MWKSRFPFIWPIRTILVPKELRLYLHWIKIIDKYKMIKKKKCYSHWYKLTYHSCSVLMKSRFRNNSTKKGFITFFTVTLRPFIKYHPLPCFPSRKITKNVETYPPPMRDVIIEQPPISTRKSLRAS